MKNTTSLRPCVAAFLLMVAMALTTSVLSFFVTPVCVELGFNRSSFTLYYSLLVASGGLSATALGQYINRNGVQKIIYLSSVWCGAGLLLLSFSSHLWSFYVIAAVMGIFATSCVSLCANIIVQQCYSSSQAATLLGFVSAGSGIGGMVFSLIVPNIIAQFGWRIGYRFLAVFWVILVLTSALVLGKTQLNVNVGNQTHLMEGMTRAQALRSPKLYLLIFVIRVWIWRK